MSAVSASALTNQNSKFLIKIKNTLPFYDFLVNAVAHRIWSAAAGHFN